MYEKHTNTISLTVKPSTLLRSLVTNTERGRAHVKRAHTASTRDKKTTLTALELGSMHQKRLTKRKSTHALIPIRAFTASKCTHAYVLTGYPAPVLRRRDYLVKYEALQGRHSECYPDEFERRKPLVVRHLLCAHGLALH